MLSFAQSESISQCASWEGVRFEDMQTFLRGCGMDFCNRADMRRLDAYMRSGPTFRHLTASPQWESYYQPMLTTWRRGYGRIAEDDPNIWPPLRTLLARLNPLLEKKSTPPTD